MICRDTDHVFERRQLGSMVAGGAHRDGAVVSLRPGEGVAEARGGLRGGLLAGQHLQAAATLQLDDGLAAALRLRRVQLGLWRI